MKLLTVFTLAVLMCFTSCYYDNELDLYGAVTDCEDPGVSYSGTILPILQGKCYACHDAVNKDMRGGGVGLDTFSLVKSYAVSGDLIKNLRGIGTSIMPPQPNLPVTDCNISKISIWISEGALEN